MHIEHKLTIGENGRILLPAKIRKLLSLTVGDQIMLVMEEELKIIPLRNTVKKIQELIKSKNKNNISLVDSLKESRLEAAKNE